MRKGHNMAMEVSELAERQAKLEGENKQIDQRVSNAEQNQRDVRIQMDDKFGILLARMDNTFNELRQDNFEKHKDLSNQIRQSHKDLSDRMHKDFKWLIGAILGTGILLKIIDKVW